ncbi:MAG TPA: DNA-3-methyladenine glycosylase [Candidatus Saccharimonadales bacterium]|nr:DNA-3-methyladenine glycosylase [Candidatus Saccharimonadales bacterium]
MTRELQKAVEHLSRNDPVLTPIIKRAGLATIQPHQNYYWELVDSIISQQLSVKAAASIERRFQELFGQEVPAPEQILTKSVEELRAVGLSNAKANYIRDLAQHIVDGKLKFDRLDEQTNEEIMAELIDVKGIGEWTAHMFLIFCMGRLDVLPTGDLGIRNGIRKLYGFEHVPTPQKIIELAEKNHWHPYESVASWYIWHSIDNKPAL